MHSKIVGLFLLLAGSTYAVKTKDRAAAVKDAMRSLAQKQAGSFADHSAQTDDGKRELDQSLENELNRDKNQQTYLDSALLELDDKTFSLVMDTLKKVQPPKATTLPTSLLETGAKDYDEEVVADTEVEPEEERLRHDVQPVTHEKHYPYPDEDRTVIEIERDFSESDPEAGVVDEIGVYGPIVEEKESHEGQVEEQEAQA